MELILIDYGSLLGIESDRKIETIVSTESISKPFANQLKCYAFAFEQQTYREVWGIPSLRLGRNGHRNPFAHDDQTTGV